MMKDKLIPKRRFKEFENHEAWEQCKLGDIGKTFSGLSGKNKDDFGHGDAEFVTYLNIFNNPISDIDQTEKVEIDKKQNEVQYGDIFFTTSSETPEEVGMSSVWLANKPNVYLNSFCFGYRVTEKIDLYYMAYMLRAPVVRKEFQALSQGISRYNISKNKAMDIPLYIPKKEEQKKLGAFFYQLDNLITLHKHKLKKLKELKLAYLSEMFPKEGEKYPIRRFAGFNYPWEQRKLGDMGKTFTGLSGKTKNDFGHGDAEFVTYLNVFNNPISNIYQTEKVEIDKKQNEVQYGDIFFTTSSETPEEVGMSSVWLANKPNVYLNSFCFGYRVTEEIDLYYMAYMLRAPVVRKEFQALSQGISRYNISKNKAMYIPLYIPKKEEQEKIGEFFLQLDNLITLHQRKLEKLENIKKAYLHEMFV